MNLPYSAESPGSEIQICGLLSTTKIAPALKLGHVVLWTCWPMNCHLSFTLAWAVRSVGLWSIYK